jgi:hypothetical protein
MTVRRPRPKPKRSVSIPSLIAVVADVLVSLMLVLIMPVD